jgi:hypothetical protein
MTDPARWTSSSRASLFAAALLGALVWMQRSWRWPAAMVGAQAVVAVLRDPTAGLLPLGLVVFALLALPLVGIARLGAWLGEQKSA